MGRHRGHDGAAAHLRRDRAQAGGEQQRAPRLRPDRRAPARLHVGCKAGGLAGKRPGPAHFTAVERKSPEGPTVTEDDLENIIETVEDEGLIDEEQSALLQSALDFDDVLAYEIITPRVDMLAIDIEDSLQDVIETASASPYSRLPVYEDTVDNIIGILHLNHFFKALLDDEAP